MHKGRDEVVKHCHTQTGPLLVRMVGIGRKGVGNRICEAVLKLGDRACHVASMGDGWRVEGLRRGEGLQPLRE